MCGYEDGRTDVESVKDYFQVTICNLTMDEALQYSTSIFKYCVTDILNCSALMSTVKIDYVIENKQEARLSCTRKLIIPIWITNRRIQKFEFVQIKTSLSRKV